ncbi:fibrobacter succinogenes major paralogous domain-containing protein [Pontibacter sp. G13]|uniref:fibrobacter succinogenes major paralogous domain-containing protein n=1 Tax=Pontibacter sp. G13 TaxID=3074898 RepID=UPI00288BFE94|nr:fibrobacter succinogenes major paralogous domain-containing protein [Pontibacter sp. G13]WNJ19074.1 fibrobacter succinogenes major paralogous domain-containing protein [Pontibacter sp. G13]
MKNAYLLFVCLALLSGCSPTESDELTDTSGNRYQIRQYGNTLWMTENLRTTRDAQGDLVTYYFPNGAPSNAAEFGLLYDFETACKVCPRGWKLPTNEDWDSLLRMANLAASFKDSLFWNGESNSNESGFTLRPSGYGNEGEHDNQFGERAILWSCTWDGKEFVWTYIAESGRDSIRSASQHPPYAFSVRCIKLLKE